MKISRQSDRRANQKSRTRAALVEAAARLLRDGPPTVAEAADAARISRATAYRYFPTQEALLVEVADLAPVVAPVEDVLANLVGGDAESRLLEVLDAHNAIALREQAPMRMALRVYLDTWLASRRRGADPPAVREGRRMRWLDTALAPVRGDFTPAQWRRVKAALSLTFSIDAIVVMKDVCRLADDEALEVLRWSAAALLRAALEAPSALAARGARAAGTSRPLKTPARPRRSRG